jgi:hypothetical protein
MGLYQIIQRSLESASVSGRGMRGTFAQLLLNLVSMLHLATMASLFCSICVRQGPEMLI